MIILWMSLNRRRAFIDRMTFNKSFFFASFRLSLYILRTRTSHFFVQQENYAVLKRGDNLAARLSIRYNNLLIS